MTTTDNASKTNTERIDLNGFVHLASRLGHHYLAAGGPTSRIEMLLSQAGRRLGIVTEVFATSTGVFVTCRHAQYPPTITVLERIINQRTDMGELLRLEKLIDEFVHGIRTIEQMQEALREVVPPHPLVEKLRPLFLFLIGVSTSLPHYGLWFAAVTSGVITISVAWVAGPLASRWKLSGVFSDFLGCTLALFLSTVCSQWTAVPREAFVVGGLVYLAPGVALTNAISEMAEHNFVSGTAKMMRAMLNLLAIATAFLLMQDIARISPQLPIVNAFVPEDTIWTSDWARLIFSTVSVISFSLLFRVPWRLLPLAICTAITSLWVLHLFSGSQFMVIGSFLPAFSVGLLSLFFSRFLQVPSQMFSLPGIFALVPGMLALSSFYGHVDESGMNIGMRVAVAASSIVFGLFTARIPFIAFRKQTPWMQ